MNYNEVKELIKNSEKDDWIHKEELDTFTLKTNVNIRIDSEYTDEAFHEEWAEKHADSSTRKIYYTVYYNNSYIDQNMMVSVDGGRAVMPVPKTIKNLRVLREKYDFGKIVCNDLRRYEEYIEHCKFDIVESY